MHRELEDAIREMDLDTDAEPLRKAAEFSDEVREELSDHLEHALGSEDDGIGVVLAGSLARGEATAASDLDYFLIVHRLPMDVRRTRNALNAIDVARQRLPHGLTAPGATGIFGRVFSAVDLVEHIGLQDDSNLNQTRRMLLLQESAPVYAPELHQALLKAIVERYLADYARPKAGVPRFILNDVLRYWRTLSVDYQAKRWESCESGGWGLRYLKLRMSRKVGLAGTLASLFLCKEATPDYFVDQFSMPALARLAQLRKHVSTAELEHLKTVFRIYAKFIEALWDREFRDEAKAVQSRVASSEYPERFRAMKRESMDLHDALQALFFESEALREHSQRLLAF